MFSKNFEQESCCLQDPLSVSFKFYVKHVHIFTSGDQQISAEQCCPGAIFHLEPQEIKVGSESVACHTKMLTPSATVFLTL